MVHLCCLFELGGLAIGTNIVLGFIVVLLNDRESFIYYDRMITITYYLLRDIGNR